MAYTLQELSDFEDIRTLKHRYFRGIDTADRALLENLFTDDVFVEYRGGEYKVHFEGRDAMLEFLANSFHEKALGMHHGHMPEITLTGENTAEGIWYLEDIFINLLDKTHTVGSAIYRDQYRRENGQWKIARTEYDRVIEFIRPVTAEMKITSHMLAKVGRKEADLKDASHLITWFKAA